MKKWIYRAGAGIAGVLFVASAMTLVAPKTVHALVSALVTVANTSSNPVPVQSVDNPALHPFQATGTCNSPCNLQILTVPTGLTAVVQDVSGTCSLIVATTLFPSGPPPPPPPGPPDGIELTSTSGLNVFPDGQIDLTPVLFHTQIVTQAIPNSPFTSYRAVSRFGFGRQATLYAASASGAQGSFGFSESDSDSINSASQCDVSISGYYVKNGQ